MRHDFKSTYSKHKPFYKSSSDQCHEYIHITFAKAKLELFQTNSSYNYSSNQHYENNKIHIKGTYI